MVVTFSACRFFVFCLFALSLVSSVSATNWYISNKQYGTGDATSWATARNLKDFTESFYSSRVMPGDTVYIDGGVDNLTYTYVNNGNSNFSTFYWHNSGTTDKRIVLTRGKDVGHNGTPIIEGAFADTSKGYYGKNAFYSNAINFELSHMKFTQKDTMNYRLTNGNLRHILYFEGVGSYDILYNDVDYTYGTGIKIYRPQNVRILHNTITTRVTNDIYSEDGMYISGANDGVNYGNLEIAYNTIISRNGYNGAADNNHDDLIQVYALDLRGGTSSVHHNFFGQFAMQTPKYGNGLQFERNVLGTWNFYNNIWAYNNSGRAYLIIGRFVDVNPNNPLANISNPLIVNMYNNIFYSTRASAVMFNDGINTLRYKNNVVYHPGSNIFVMTANAYANMQADMDYNQYYVDERYCIWNSTGQAWIGKTAFLTRFPQPHSQFGNITLVNVGTASSAGYMYVSGSSGIDDGTPIAWIVDDYAGTSRPQGPAWDIGAFEYISGAIIYHPADLNQDGCVSLGEISAYVGLWLNGEITLGTVSGGVSEWLGGC